MPVVHCRTRKVVRYAATALAVAGWGVSALAVAVHGREAGILPGFIAALSVAIAFTMVAGLWWMLPSRDEREESAAVYALGFAAGQRAMAQSLQPDPPRLSAVR